MMSIFTLLLASHALAAAPAETVVRVDANRVIHRVSPLLYGACIEDVNHEIYGGLYSRMIFGESFQEPPRARPIAGFTAYGGGWSASQGVLSADAGDGPKLVADQSSISAGAIGVEIFFPSDQPGNAGLIVDVNNPGVGADAFTGYEISLETSGKLVIGRHRRNWTPILEKPVAVPSDRWIALVVQIQDRSIEAFVDGKSVAKFDDREHRLAPGSIGLRTWRRSARFRNLWVKSTDDKIRKFSLESIPRDSLAAGVSGMWGAIERGSARGEASLESKAPFVGKKSQRLTYLSGEGEIGIENQGLNRQGMWFVADKPYEGGVWARADRPAEVFVAIESRDGKQIYTEARFQTISSDWKRYDFTLTSPTSGEGRFAIKLKRPGSIELGLADLEPGEWGRFKGLPVRKDVALALVDQRVTVLRYGGSMINHKEYRWKNMIGPRDLRPPTAGTWYPYSSNGWGIFDFLAFCEAAGFEAIPAVNVDETPEDMADFVEYALGPANGGRGRERAADGRTAPYKLKYLEIGNEEAINDDYWKKFAPIAEAIWAKNRDIILVVGDFAYGRVIADPYRFEGGAASNTLETHRKILELAKKRGREIWFDIHISTDHPPEPNGLLPERSYIDRLGEIAPGANYKVVIFEFNSGNHAMKRALSNALAINEVERIGARLPIACVANCLQPDGQNDNGWDQGLLFLNPRRVWLQPPGYVAKMASGHYQPLLVESSIAEPVEGFSVNAKKSEDGATLTLQVVNAGEHPRPARIHIDGFTPLHDDVKIETISGPLEGVNTATAPEAIKPISFKLRNAIEHGELSFTFTPHSFTIIQID